jgi:hypothetical protein
MRGEVRIERVSSTVVEDARARARAVLACGGGLVVGVRGEPRHVFAHSEAPGLELGELRPEAGVLFEEARHKGCLATVRCKVFALKQL